MTYSLTVDPGRGGLGWAVGYNGRLTPQIGIVKAPKGPRDFVAAPIQAVAANALKEIPRLPYTLGAVERMRHYSGTSKSNPNDLLDLQAIGGIVLGSLVPAAQIVYYAAQEWMGGQLSEESVKRQVLRLLSADEQSDLAEALRKYPKGQHTHAFDAVGIFLKLHGRWRHVAA